MQMSIWILLALALPAALCSSCTVRTLKLVPPAVESMRVPDTMRGAHAVFLYDAGWVHYHSIGVVHGRALAFTRKARIKILTRSGTERYGSLEILHIGDLIRFEGYVEKPDGRRVAVGAGDVKKAEVRRDVIEGAVPPVHLYKTIVVFPDLSSGDILGYDYTRHGVESSWSFSRLDAPVLFSRFAIEKRWKRLALEGVLTDRHDLKPAKHVEMAASAIYMNPHHIWTARNVPSIPSEPYMPPVDELSSRISVWYKLPDLDLAKIAGTYFHWFTHGGAPVPAEIRSLAVRICAGVEDESERVRRLRRWALENLALDDPERIHDISPYWDTEPIRVGELLEKRAASLEEATCLLRMLLLAAGIDTGVVLCARPGRPGFDPGILDTAQFTHVFLSMPDGRLIGLDAPWLDAGQVGWAFFGRKALWMRRDYHEVKPVPTPSAGENRMEIRVQAKLSASGEIAAEARLRYLGLEAARVRRALWSATEGQVERWILDRATEAGEVEIADRTIENKERPGKELALTVRYRPRRKAELQGEKMIFHLGPLAGWLRVPDFGKGERRLPARLPFATSRELALEIGLPEGLHLTQPPEPVRFSSSGENGLQLERSTSVKDGLVKVDLAYRARDRDLTLAQVKECTAPMARFRAERDAVIVLERGP
ncbi:MAG: hypothetical protein JXR96_21535 [Deltaproteobacteria bacterium]|nr:hypothetical protein [Deltaproteobacteria bacterium]